MIWFFTNIQNCANFARQARELRISGENAANRDTSNLSYADNKRPFESYTNDCTAYFVEVFAFAI